MDGWHLASHLAAMQPRPAIVFISGYAHIGAGNLSGLVLAKPEQLLDAVRQLLLGWQPRSA